MGWVYSNNKYSKEAKFLTQLDKHSKYSSIGCRILFSSILNNYFNIEKFNKDEKYKVYKLHYFNHILKSEKILEVSNNDNNSICII